jgi:hypothetical protein
LRSDTLFAFSWVITTLGVVGVVGLGMARIPRVRLGVQKFAENIRGVSR